MNQPCLRRRRKRKKKRKRAISGRHHISLYLTPPENRATDSSNLAWEWQENEEAMEQWDDMLPEFPVYSSFEMLREQQVIERSPIMVLFMYLDVLFKNEETMVALIEEGTIHMMLVDMLMLMESMQLRYLALSYVFFDQGSPYALKLLPQEMHPPGFTESNANVVFPPVSLELLDANRDLILERIRDASEMEAGVFDSYVDDLATW